MVRSSTMAPSPMAASISCGRREGPARLAQQALQQAELGRRQVQLLPVDGGPVADAVDAHAEVLDHVAGSSVPLSTRRCSALMRCSSTLTLNGLVT